MASPLLHTTLSELVKKLLKSIDNYNSQDVQLSTDTTDQNSGGEVARICLNQALQLIYAKIKTSRYFDAFPTQNLSTVIGQDYIDLDPEATLDDIESVVDETNIFKLQRKSWGWYKRHFVNPSLTSGQPLYYIRRNNRLYLAPRPSAAIALTIDFRKIPKELKLNGDVPLIPSQFDVWIIAEASVFWFKMEDPQNIPPIVISERDDIRQSCMESIFEGYDETLQAASNTEPERLSYLPYQRPVGGA